MTRYDNNTDYFEMWCDDKRSIIDIMVKNMVSDLDNGYDYFGKSIQQQQHAIETYKQEYEKQLMAFYNMGHESVNKWCFIDLIRRGAIE